MFKEQSDPLRYTFIFLDLAISAISFGVSFYIRFYILKNHGIAISTLPFDKYVMMASLLSVNQVISFFIVDLYQARRIKSFFDEVGPLLAGIALNLLLSLAIVFFLQAENISRFTVLIFSIVNFVFILVSHALARFVTRTRRRKGINVKPVVVLGTGRSARRIANSLARDPLFGYRIAGFVGTSDGVEKSLGTIDQLESILENTDARLVICALDDSNQATIGKVLTVCDSAGVSLKLIPGFSDFVAIHGRIENVDGLPVVSVRNIPAREGFNRILKRFFDIVFSLLFIIIFSPVYLLTALLVKLTSPGPVFFKQERIGLDGRTFSMVKFRTMQVQAAEHSATIWTTKDDPRVTPIGKFLRKTSIDEFPQFFNVLSGRMSVVGPRPERPYYVDQFRGKYDFYMRRHSVKAGITGWAQINGLRGDTSIEERALADIYYIENWSMLLDLKIILLTPFKGFFNSNAY